LPIICKSADQIADVNDAKIQELKLVIENLEQTVKTLSTQVDFLLSFVDATDISMPPPQKQHENVGSVLPFMVGGLV